MEYEELIRERYSVRKYSQEPIEGDKLDLILEAGRLAPTGHNNQPQRVYVLKSEEAVEKIRSLTRCAFNAPVVLMITYNKEEEWKNDLEPGQSSGVEDAVIAATHMMLEAWEQGLGSVWVRLFDVKAAAKAFGLPPYMRPVCLLPVGYASEDCVPYAPWHDVYRPIESFCKEL